LPIPSHSFVHLYLAVKSFYEGLAIYGLYQWAAWRAVPPDCPSCNVRLRPSLPELPWLKSFQRRRDGYAPVLVNDEDRYRDDIESGAAAAGADTSVPADTAVQPEAVEVRRKDRKSKSSSASEASPWEA
jgi:hypothetical protein